MKLTFLFLLALLRSSLDISQDMDLNTVYTFPFKFITVKLIRTIIAITGFYQGLGPQFYHSHDFQHSREFHHEHTPDCHNRGRPRHPPPPPPPPAPTQSTSTTTAPPSVDPRASTMAGIVSTEVPSIDIRFARHTQNGADRIVFED